MPGHSFPSWPRWPGIYSRQAFNWSLAFIPFFHVLYHSFMHHVNRHTPMMMSLTWLVRSRGNGEKISDGTTPKNSLNQMSSCLQVWSAKVDKIDYKYRSPNLNCENLRGFSRQVESYAVYMLINTFCTILVHLHVDFVFACRLASK